MAAPDSRLAAEIWKVPCGCTVPPVYVRRIAPDAALPLRMTMVYVPAVAVGLVRRSYDGTGLKLFWNVLTEVDRPPLAMVARLPVAAASALMPVGVAVGVRVAVPVPEPPVITVEPATPRSM